MKIHEYQAKEILRKYGVAVPNGEMAISIEEADTAAKQLFSAGHAVVVIKAQIHAGGRGKGGGVKLAKTLEDAATHSKAILGMQLVTHQTGPAGQKVQRLLVEAGSDIARELYLGLVLDRASSKVVFMASQAGGMEIEEVAHETPEKIFKEYVDPAIGFQPYQARSLAFKLGLEAAQIGEAEVCAELHQAGWEYGLHGERRGAGDGDDGHYFVCRWVGGKLSGCGGWGEPGAD